MSDPATPAAGLSTYPRAVAHLEAQARRRAGTLLEGPPGMFGVLDSRWPASHTSNRVLVTSDLPVGYGVDDVLVFVDEVFGGRGLTHRKVDVLDDATAALITPALVALGFSHDEILVMAAQPVPLPDDDQGAVPAVVVEESVVRPLVERGWHVEAEDYSAETVRQLVERRDAIDRVGTVTRLAVLDPATGDAVAKTDLVVADGVAEVDDVMTLPEHRGRGYASALVRLALSLAEGCDFAYLQAAAEDWPKHLYAKLGFETVGRVHEHSLLDLPGDAEPADA